MARSEAEAELAEVASRRMRSKKRIAVAQPVERGTAPAEIENLRRDLAGLQSQLAVLQERRSTIAREIETLSQQAADLEERAAQRRNADPAGRRNSRKQTRATIESLEKASRTGLSERDRLDAVDCLKHGALEELRRELARSGSEVG